MEYNLQNFDHSINLEQEEHSVDDVVKIVFVGDSGVGKTNIFYVFTANQFNINSKATIGVDFVLKTVRYGSHFLKLQIWDTAGQERYKSFTNAYYQEAKGIIIVYDVTDRSTFSNVQAWLKNIQETVNKDSIILVLIGNKIDLKDQRQVSTSEGESFAKANGLLFMETSALQNSEKNNPDKIGQAFFNMIQNMQRNKLINLNEQQKELNVQKGPQIDLDENQKKSKGCC